MLMLILNPCTQIVILAIVLVGVQATVILVVQNHVRVAMEGALAAMVLAMAVLVTVIVAVMVHVMVVLAPVKELAKTPV